jgi:hypothetical protein
MSVFFKNALMKKYELEPSVFTLPEIKEKMDLLAEQTKALGQEKKQGQDRKHVKELKKEKKAILQRVKVITHELNQIKQESETVKTKAMAMDILQTKQQLDDLCQSMKK